MKRILLIGNGLIAAFFLAAIFYTLVGKDHLRQLAADYVSQKLQPRVERSVTLIAGALQTQAVRNAVKEEQIAAAIAEIERFKISPRAYIRSLTAADSPLALRTQAAIPDPVTAKMADWRQSIHRHFHRVYDRLLWDLRIFAPSNLIAACASLFLVRRFGPHPKVVAISLVLFVAMLFAASVYIDRSWFFAILTGSFMGMWYPIVIGVSFVYLYRRLGRGLEAIALAHCKTATPFPESRQE
jgi:hypothetical protein